jgi:Ala-tRNA(Pro) deacylase
MSVTKLERFLDDHGVRYVSIRHSPAFTAQEVAASSHIPGKDVAKTVMVKLDHELALAVLPASQRVDLDRLRIAVGARTAELATEEEFRGRFPDCEVGAMPPFGNLYGMRTYVADTLTEDDEIAFNAGTHTELLRLAYDDFHRLVEPRTLAFGVPRA